MAEEQKGSLSVTDPIEDEQAEQFFINEDQFEDVVPEFGTCGGGDDDQEAPEEVKLHSCGKEDCCREKGNTSKCGPESAQEETKVEAVTPAPIKNPCYKCKEKSAKYVNKQDVVCKDCLMWMLTHRFKNALVRYVRVQKDYPNLVAVSGGSNSMAMLHFLYCCLSGNTSQKKMFFKIHVLHIDESQGVNKTSLEQATANKALIAETCERYGFSYTILPIEKVYELNRDACNSEPEDMDQAKYKTVSETMAQNQTEQLDHPDKLEQYQGKIWTLLGSLEASFAADVALFLKKWLLADFCLKHNFKRVLLGTTGHKIATQLLGQMAKGRGASIFSEVAYSDDKNFGGRVNFCNPMKEFLQKEIAIFNFNNSVPIIAQQPLVQQRNSGVKQPPFFGSTDLLVEGFFKGLQAGYNVNTVPTVVRLTNKLQKQAYASSGYPFCPLCLGPRDPVNNLLEIGSTIKSIRHGVDGEAPTIESVTKPEEWFAGSAEGDVQVEQAFCFGCKRLCIETKPENRSAFISSLPQFMKDNASRTLAADSVDGGPGQEASSTQP